VKKKTDPKLLKRVPKEQLLESIKRDIQKAVKPRGKNV
jgi:hypothetical protein